MLTADPDADLEFSLAEMRRQRKRKRLADVHIIDALYRADLTALVGGGAIYALAGAIGDTPLNAGQLDSVTAHGAGWLGLAVAFAVAIGLRSGSRGGPLVLEQAEVRHVLLAPVDRTTAVRGPALRQVRFLVFVAILVGAVVGILTARRLDGNAAAWTACGALYAAVAVTVSYGAALCAAAWRLPSWIGTTIGAALVALALVDGLDVVNLSPLTAWGEIGMWPEGFGLLGLAALVVSVTVLLVGFVRVGDLSVEAAERRSTLVGQLRFAATLQDLRTVIVLRRQLAIELPRLRPWLRLPVRGTGRLPVWTRDWRGILRWPAARVGRLALLAVSAGLALRGAWEGTTPLLGLAGVALFIAGLDAVEPLAQEVDHPSRAETIPVERGVVHVRHLPAAVAVMVLVAIVGAAVALALEPSVGGLAVAAVCVVPAALGGVAGAVTSVLSDPVLGGGGDAWALVAPEAAGMRLVMRTAWPPALAIGGTLPLLAARSAAEHNTSAVGAALTASILVVAVFALVVGWVRWRDDLHAAIERALPSKPEPGAKDRTRET